MMRHGNAMRRPNKAITQTQAGVHLDMLLVGMSDALLASHDEYTLGRMFAVPLKAIRQRLADERARRTA